ncbi:MAG: Gfo/Idh/MocA family oxidoreductase [Acidimicrobiia bacterium]|nr:Gfo/Idh/MocA family oxidoreductase [Acidimicrobiia bacterium]
MDELRYGIVGAGMMGCEHIENVIATGRGVVTAVADPHEPSQKAAIEAVGDQPRPMIFDHHVAMLEAGVCDAVVVATPNMTHRSVLGDVLAAPVHVLVEKPLCITVAECREVIVAAADRRELVWVGLEYRYMPPVARLLAEVGAGAVGTVHMVAAREHRFPFLTKVGSWNRFSAQTGGTLVEKCCHYFDLMVLATGGARPVRVFASGGQSVNHLDEVYAGRTPDILDNAYVIVDFDSGARGMLDLCMFAEATRNQEELVVVGDAGKVEALVPEGVVRVGRRGEHWIGGVEEITVVDHSVVHQGLHHGSSYVEHIRFLDAIENGTPPEVTLLDGLLAVAIGEAAHRSIDERRPIEMNEVL